jgi:uncharacterized protein (TIGR00251 family)
MSQRQNSINVKIAAISGGNTRMGFERHIENNRIAIIVKPNSKENKILEWDQEQKALKVQIKAPAQDGKANRELIRFLSKISGRKAAIKSGITGKRKILVFE